MSETQTTPFVNTPEILYRLRAANGDLLYVGITRDWPLRMTQHQRDKPWWSEVAGVELVKVYGTRPQIEAIERAVIKTEQPTYNKTHNAEVRRMTLPKIEERELLFWREEADGNITKFHRGDQVFTFGMVGTLVDFDPASADLDYTVLFPGEDKPFRIDGTCSIRHAIPGEPDEVW